LRFKPLSTLDGMIKIGNHRLITEQFLGPAKPYRRTFADVGLDFLPGATHNSIHAPHFP
jgi:hypothetical protein